MGDDTVSSKRWRARSTAALIVFIIAALLTPVALVGHWGHRTIVDSTRYIDTVGPLIEIPEVQDGIATAISDAVVTKIDMKTQVEGLLDGILPDNSSITSLLSAPIAAGVNSLIGELAKRFVASSQFQAVWIGLNTAAQRGLMALLEGGQEGPVRLQGDDIILDISAALGRVQQFLVDNGITAAANITLPEDDRQIVLFTTPAIAQIQFIYSLTSPILQWFPLVIGALFLLAFALARRRARLVVTAGIVLVAEAGLLTVGLNAGEDAFVDNLAGTPFGPASAIFWSTLLTYLIDGVQAILVLGILVIVAGWYGGRTAIAVRLRGHLIRGLDELGDRLTGLHPLRRWVGARASAIRWGIYIVVGALLLFADVASPASVLSCVALAAGLVTLVQLLADSPTVIPPATEAPPVTSAEISAPLT